MTDWLSAGRGDVRECRHSIFARFRRASRFAGPARWLAALLFAIAVHAGAAAYLLSPTRLEADGTPDDAIPVELTPYVSEASDKPDDVVGPKVANDGAAMSEIARAEDPEPPAPESAPPTETEHKPAPTPDLTAPSAPAAEATLPAEKPEQRPPDPQPLEKETLDAKKDDVERRTAPSRASNGSVAELEGGKHASPAARATWAGAVGSHIAHLRRYPRKARAEGWQGTARVRVTIDENGHVKDRSLVKSSGRAVLDEEALSLMQRSDPFPKPPSGMSIPVALTVPVNFEIR